MTICSAPPLVLLSRKCWLAGKEEFLINALWLYFCKRNACCLVTFHLSLTFPKSYCYQIRFTLSSRDYCNLLNWEVHISVGGGGNACKSIVLLFIRFISFLGLKKNFLFSDHVLPMSDRKGKEMLKDIIIWKAKLANLRKHLGIQLGELQDPWGWIKQKLLKQLWEEMEASWCCFTLKPMSPSQHSQWLRAVSSPVSLERSYTQPLGFC